MTRRAWYLDCAREDIADHIVLIGDPGRVPRMSEHLGDVRILPVNRGLAMATGYHGDTLVTLAAYGMGAPIAAIVLHELADLGARVMLRMGTSMCLSPDHLGRFVVAETALGFDGTSPAYARAGGVAVADELMVQSLVATAGKHDCEVQTGVFASYDAFYMDMFALDDRAAGDVERNLNELRERDVIAIDMETSAILTAGNALGCQVSSLCIASVDGVTKEKLSREEMQAAESKLTTMALDAVSAMPLDRTDDRLQA